VDTVQQTLDIIQRALARGRNVELRNFGVLEVQVRKERVGRNPNRPTDTVVIPERAVVKFKSGKVLKAELGKIDLMALKRSGRVETASDIDESASGGASDGASVEDHPMRRKGELRAQNAAGQKT
jgi:nucleoid DNA-binding protein